MRDNFEQFNPSQPQPQPQPWLLDHRQEEEFERGRLTLTLLILDLSRDLARWHVAQSPLDLRVAAALTAVVREEMVDSRAKAAVEAGALAMAEALALLEARRFVGLFEERIRIVRY